MTISLGQILIVIVVALLLFGNFPNILKDLSKSLKGVVKFIQESNNKLPSKEVKKQEKRDSNP
jgi:Sec-independent protein translocase protein TatA